MLCHIEMLLMFKAKCAFFFSVQKMGRFNKKQKCYLHACVVIWGHQGTQGLSPHRLFPFNWGTSTRRSMISDCVCEDLCAFGVRDACSDTLYNMGSKDEPCTVLWKISNIVEIIRLNLKPQTPPITYVQVKLKKLEDRSLQTFIHFSNSTQKVKLPHYIGSSHAQRDISSLYLF